MTQLSDRPTTTPVAAAKAPHASAPWWGPLRFFQPDPPAAEKIRDPAAIKPSYRTYQNQILIATMVGYAAFYFVRKNLSVAIPMMEAELGISKTQLGLFLTLHGVIYGVSKFANGYLGDHSNARVFMVTGLVACALLNISFGLAMAVLAFGVIWMANGWFQGMGFPPCARLLTHWFPPRVLATKMSLWNAGHSIGAAGVTGLGAILVWMGFGWQALFFAPSAIALIVALYLWMTLKDTPESLGLPAVETLNDSHDASADIDAETAENLHESLDEQPSKGYMRKVFTNPYIWLIALANFFVYTVRYAIFDWAPSIFSQAKGFELHEAAWITVTFEVAGIAGMLAAGWITDNFFGGRGARTCLFYMAACTAAIFALWKLPLHSGLVAAGLMSLAGFFIYGPQALVGIAVANLATKHAAATAVGLTGLFGYLSGIVSGWGIGRLADVYGWDRAFEGICGFALFGTVLFALAWFAPAHGYTKSREHRN